jgi:hypothetical protein
MSQNTAVFATPDRYEDFKLGMLNYSLFMLFCEKSRSLILLCTSSYYFREEHKLQVYCNLKKLQQKIFGPDDELISKQKL